MLHVYSTAESRFWNGRLDFRVRPGLLCDASTANFLIKTAGNINAVQDFTILCIWKIPTTVIMTRPQKVLGKLSQYSLLVKKSVLSLLVKLLFFFLLLWHSVIIDIKRTRNMCKSKPHAVSASQENIYQMGDDETSH